MAKKALLDVLEQTIGKYVKNLDAESLNVAVWSGKIELHNLELDTRAVNAELDRQAAEAPNLEIPFRVRSGKFHKFQVDVPWAHLMSRSVVLRAQGLQVSIEPRDRTETLDHLYTSAESEAARSRRILDQRKRSIQATDDFRQKSNALRKLTVSGLDEAASKAEGSSSTFTTRLARRIVENIQMEINDVHIELHEEENSAGLVLESLQLVTTDKDGKRAFVDRTTVSSGLEHAFLHKALEIKGLGIYLDELTSRPSKRLGSILEDEEMERGFDHNYVLAPLSFAARLRQADTNVCVDYPKYSLVSELEAMSILLSHRQVEQARKITEKIKPAHDVARPLFPEYRPLARVNKDSARAWWKYAFRCIGRITGRRSWVEFFRAFQLRKKYIPLYKRKAHHETASWLTPLTKDEVKIINEIENDRSISVEGLMVWRNIADAQFDKELDKHNARKEGASTGLFSSLFGTTAKADGTPAQDEPPITLTVEEMKELEIATMDQVQDAELSDDSKLCDVKFTLGSFRIHLTSSDLRQLAALDMGKVSTSFDADVDGSFVFDFRLSSLEIHDKVTPNSLFPTILRNQRRSGVAPEDDDAFRVYVDKTASGDQKLKVVLKAFEAVASPMLMVELRDFLSTSTRIPSAKVRTQNPILTQSLSGSIDLFYDATEGAESVPSMSPLIPDATAEETYLASKMADFSKFSLTENKSALVVDFDLQAPILVLPENCVDTKANILVFDMGHLRFHLFKGSEKAVKDGSITLTSLTFLVGKAGDCKRLVQKHDSSSFLGSGEAILQPLSVSVDFRFDSGTSTDDSKQLSTVDIHAKLSNLFVNWNPKTVKMIATQLERFQSILALSDNSDGGLIVSSPSHDTGSLSLERRVMDDSSDVLSGVSLRFVAELETFQISLNSAQDSLPLFFLTMSGAKISRTSSGDECTETSLVLDDVSIRSSDLGRTDPKYRTVLGLSPGQTESLLTVNYYEGKRAIEKVLGLDPKEVEAFGDVELSPMRMVYIQAQVLALVEYATAGILGSLATQVATTAASAAADIATASSSRKVFHVKATGLEVLLPQAAYRPTAFSACSGSLDLEFATMADTSSSAKVCLDGFELRDPSGDSLQDGPIQMKVDVLLPPEDVGTADDQAMRVSLFMPKASFIFPKASYSQMLATLDENIGEIDLFLREDTAEVGIQDATGSADSVKPTQVTHAGTVFVEKQRRMYLGVEIRTMSLELAMASFDDPIARLAAVEAFIKFETYPDEERTHSEISLRNLNCDDLRLRAATRQHRSLIYQSHPEDSGFHEDVFSLTYDRRDDFSQSVNVSIGSSNHVVIPDAIADILKYVEKEPRYDHERATLRDEASNHTEVSEIVEINEGTEEIETSVIPSSSIASTSISLKTGKCSLIMVDLGTEDLLQSHAFANTSQVASVAETIVFEGKFEASVELKTNNATGLTEQTTFQMHCDDIECYSAFGRDLESALQILEPTKLSLFVKEKYTSSQSKALDVRAATMEPLDIVLSMRNVALMEAISASISSCFDSDGEDQERPGIDEDEARRIERLASALDKDDTDESSHSHPSSTITTSLSFTAGSDTDDSVTPKVAASYQITAPAIQLSFINDLQGLDEPLFRLTVKNAVGNARVRDGIPAKGPSYKMFDFNTDVSILADYFDLPTNSWKASLLKPWEISTRGSREPSQRFKSPRPSTMVDIECFPCYVSFSEQFLMGVASASHMWSVYSRAIESASSEQLESKAMRKSMAASAARKFVASLPYAIENSTGTNAEFRVGGEEEARFCASGSLEYFRFRPPKGRGKAGKRQYGQDVPFKKTVDILIRNASIPVQDVDMLPGTPRRACMLGDNEVIMIDVVREGKTIVIRLSSGIEIKNNCSVPFAISLNDIGNDIEELGVCEAHSTYRPAVLTGVGGRVSKASKLFGVPTHLAHKFWLRWIESSTSQLSLTISPNGRPLPDGWTLSGFIDVEINSNELRMSDSRGVQKHIEVSCDPFPLDDTSGNKRPIGCDPFVLRVLISIELVEGRFPSVNIYLEPRATLENMIPVSIDIKSPMPHIVGKPSSEGVNDVFEIKSGSFIEVFTPGPSIAVMVKCSDAPVGGTPTDWMEGGWIDLPLVPEFRLPEPIRCTFPFTRKETDRTLNLNGGTEFFICQGSPELSDSFLERVQRGSVGGRFGATSETIEVSHGTLGGNAHNFFVTVSNFAVDHTGDILFERFMNPVPRASIRRSQSDIGAPRHSMLQPGSPLCAFATALHRGRITLLPTEHELIRLLHLTMEGDEGVRRSFPFRVEDVSISDGGVDATPLKWENGHDSGFYAYRQLIGTHQSEIHIVPEYVVFNGSKTELVRVRQPGGLEFTIVPGSIAALRTPSQQTAIISVECISVGGRTAPMRVDSLGLRVAIVRSPDGFPLGSLAIQTVVGGRDSRLVVKIGELKFSSVEASKAKETSSLGMFERDFLRFRIQWSELQVSLYEARPVTGKEGAFLESAMDRMMEVSSPGSNRRSSGEGTWMAARERITSEQNTPISGPVCTILFHRFAIDWQRVFKEDQVSSREALRSPERAQLSIIIHHIQIRDDTPNSPYPMVFESASSASFLDLCIRFKGSLSAELIKVDLFDLKLAHVHGVSQRIMVNTSEDFVWKFLDLANRILLAAGELAGVDMELAWDDEHDGYKVVLRDKKASYIEDMTHYTPPASDTLLDINRARVSPFTVVVSFKRNPQASRYTKLKGVRGAHIMNYFTQRLKFKIEKAELKFARYEVRNVKGPPDRLLELLSTVYMSRMKLKFVTLMSAASFQDWKFLADRDEGDDAFVEGDLLRVTGNIAGSTANALFKNAGRGLGHGVSFATGAIGNSIESASDAIGIKPVGAGVNAMVSGVGDGLAQTLTGVGQGAGKVFKGAGQGVGHVFGGVTGGALLMGKGIGKGIVTGDGKTVVSGITQGLSSVGTGVGQGVDSVVTGTAEGVLSVGHGVFSGVKSIGKGIGGAFTGKSPKEKRQGGRGQHR